MSMLEAVWRVRRVFMSISYAVTSCEMISASLGRNVDLPWVEHRNGGICMYFS